MKQKMATIREEYEREIEVIRAEKNPLKRRALIFEAKANLYIWQHVCHAVEGEEDEA